MMLEPATPADLLTLDAGDLVSRSGLFDLIKQSKLAGSLAWLGPEFSIGNTPQQGINWVGDPPDTKAVLAKSRKGAYDGEGWVDPNLQVFKYALKAQNKAVNRSEKANRVLLEQPMYRYPVIVMRETASAWRVVGRFNVVIATDKHVLLRPTGIEHPWDLAGTTLL